MANVLESTVTCDIALTNRFDCGSVDIWLMCSGKRLGSDTAMVWGPWGKYSCLAENQLIPLR